MRDKLIHHYFGVNIDIVWDVVKSDLPALIESLKELNSISDSPIRVQTIPDTRSSDKR